MFATWTALRHDSFGMVGKESGGPASQKIYGTKVSVSGSHANFGNIALDVTLV